MRVRGADLGVGEDRELLGPAGGEEGRPEVLAARRGFVGGGGWHVVGGSEKKKADFHGSYDSDAW